MDRFHWAERHDGLITNDVSRDVESNQASTGHDRKTGRLRNVRRGLGRERGTAVVAPGRFVAVLLSHGDTSLVALTTVLGACGELDDRIDPVRSRISITKSLDGAVCHRLGSCSRTGDVISSTT